MSEDLREKELRKPISRQELQRGRNREKPAQKNEISS